jgi:hypothetical protein
VQLPPTPQEARRAREAANREPVKSSRPVVAAELRRLCRAHTADCVGTLFSIMMGMPFQPQVDGMPVGAAEYPTARDRLTAANALLDRGFGKPVQQVETGNAGDFEKMEDRDLDAYIEKKAQSVLEKKGLRVVNGGKS